MEICVNVSPIWLLAGGLAECFLDEVVTGTWVQTPNLSGLSDMGGLLDQSGDILCSLCIGSRI